MKKELMEAWLKHHRELNTTVWQGLRHINKKRYDKGLGDWNIRPLYNIEPDPAAFENTVHQTSVHVCLDFTLNTGNHSSITEAGTAKVIEHLKDLAQRLSPELLEVLVSDPILLSKTILRNDVMEEYVKLNTMDIEYAISLSGRMAGIDQYSIPSDIYSKQDAHDVNQVLDQGSRRGSRPLLLDITGLKFKVYESCEYVDEGTDHLHRVTPAIRCADGRPVYIVMISKDGETDIRIKDRQHSVSDKNVMERIIDKALEE